MKHKPYSKLKGILREKSITYEDIAKLLNISPTSVGYKINGKSDFYIREVNAICETYGLSNQIFLE